MVRGAISRPHAAMAFFLAVSISFLPEDWTIEVYSIYTSIVRSSGMGKSRTIDELSKKCSVLRTRIFSNVYEDKAIENTTRSMNPATDADWAHWEQLVVRNEF